MKNSIKLLVILGLTAPVFMGLALPNNETTVLGNDVRNGGASLYELNVTAPETASVGQIFEARISLEHADGLPLRSSAHVVVTGGDLINQQQQKLTPDAVWQIRAGTSGTVGVVVSVTTDYLNDKNEAAASYVDVLTKRVSVAGTSQTGIYEPTKNNTPQATQGKTFALVLVAFLLLSIVVGVLMLRKRRRRL